ncbi:unnamed protein product [Acanthoscelides obtectus]|uniref:Uncharacterized protein n=1 Tax=Acanthoscelides obtectus TaxID=200917 RepID=A0A9P0Q0L3_ACAOB|nr:unnamed protein product [Acanthoscelides obtectus]CAK1688289.1 hypothetical protein AOBTE_LOCUS36674 [Acanthoscelides obtectus]
MAGAVTFPRRVQKFFLGSLLRYEAWCYPVRISLSSDSSKKAVSG